jgi:hypothetical protein
MAEKAPDNTIASEADDKQAQDDFDSGFVDDEAPPPVETAEPKAQAPEPKEAAAIEAAPEPQPVPTPKYVQITQEEHDAIKAAIARSDALEKRLRDTIGGTVGEMEQRLIKKMQAGTPAGAPIEISEEAFSEMDQEYPDLVRHLKKVLKGVRGTAPTVAAAEKNAVDPDAIARLVKAQAVAHEREALDFIHPTWLKTVGAIDAEGRYDANNPFRVWLATRDQAYQAKVNGTNSSAVILHAINDFKAATKPAQTPPKPAVKIAARNDRIRSAVQPRGDGGQPPPAKTLDDYFNEGFSG